METENLDAILSESSTDETNGESVVPDDKQETPKQIPFDQDPRVQEYINRAVEKRAKDMETQLAERLAPKGQDEEIPAWFGSKDVNLFKQFQSDVVERAKQEAIREFQSANAKQQEAVANANKYFEDSVKELETSGFKVDRNKLLKYTFDNDLVDSQGRWNYKAAAKLLQIEEKENATEGLGERKKLAARTNSDHRGEGSSKDVRTSDDFKNSSNRPW